MAKILVVDDEPDMESMLRLRYRNHLHSGLINLCFAQDGAQALEILDKIPDIELVVTDIKMPGMDGLTLLERIADRSNLTAMTIIMSAYGDIANIRAGMNRGAFDFVTKPIAFDDLERVVTRALEKGRMNRMAREAHVRVLEMQKEFEWARRVQLGILPRPWPSDGPERLIGFMRPAHEVGGDAYDFILINEDLVGFAIGDVAGKGIPAAIVAAVTHALLRVLATELLDPADCVGRLNHFLTAHYPEILFVTLLYCVLDRKTGVVSFANGGHPWPLKLDRDGNVVSLAGEVNIPVGITDKGRWSTMSVRLNPGDRLFLFTDGLSEAMGSAAEPFGEPRLRQALQALAHEKSDELIRKLIAVIDEFTGNGPASDDITCLMLDWDSCDGGQPGSISAMQ